MLQRIGGSLSSGGGPSVTAGRSVSSSILENRIWVVSGATLLVPEGMSSFKLLNQYGLA